MSALPTPPVADMPEPQLPKSAQGDPLREAAGIFRLVLIMMVIYIVIGLGVWLALR